MPLYRGNDTNLLTEPLTDAAGAPLTVGTVEAEVFTEDGATSLIASGVMSHVADGVWKRTLQAEDIDGLPDDLCTRVLIRVTVGSPPDATFSRVEHVVDRRSS